MTNDPLAELAHEFFGSVSFRPGKRPGYGRIRDLFIPDGRLIRATADAPEITGVEEFIAPRQRAVDAGELTAFEEVETAGHTDVFGHAGQRRSRYDKRGVRNGAAFAGRGMVFTQFVRTPAGWRISAMAWDDERPGLTLPDR